MSYTIQEDQEIEERRFRKKRRWIIGAVALLVLGTVLIINSGWNPIPDVGGGLIIEADPDTRIYVGDKLVGTTSVTFSWRELFGDERDEGWQTSSGVINSHKGGKLFGHERDSGIAIEISDPAQGVTPEMLSGPGATKLSEPTGMATTGMPNVQVIQQRTHLIRRADGSLDEVLALVLVWSPPDRPSARYLLPVRLRKGQVPSTVHFDSASGQIIASSYPGIWRFFGRGNEAKTKYSFTAKSPPPQFAEEIRTKGLWEPTGEK